MERSWLDPPARPRHERAPAAARHGQPAARLLALQRAAGNQAVTRLLGRRARPPGIQRFVARVDDPGDLQGTESADFVKTAEVDRMADYVKDKANGDVIDLRKAGKVEVTAGEHWFVGHGSGADFGGLTPDAFHKLLSFSGLPVQQQATLHLVSCNLGKVQTADSFAKQLRQLLWKDPAAAGKTIVIEAAPAFIVHTEGAQVSFPSKPAEVTALHRELEAREEEIDAEVGLALWGKLKALLLDTKRRAPTKAGFKGYLSGLDNGNARAGAQAVESVKGNSPTAREEIVNALDTFANAEPALLLHSATTLARKIDLMGETAAKDLVTAARTQLKELSKQAWLGFEVKIAAKEGKAAKKTLTANAPDRAEVKQKLRAKDEATVAEYGWIQYSTKGKSKGADEEKTEVSTPVAADTDTEH